MGGRDLLAAYLTEKKLTHEAFAARAGVPGPQVSLWLSGHRRPGLENAFRIQDATGGAVPASSWRERAGARRSVRKPTRGRRTAAKRAAARLVRAVHEESFPHLKP